MYNKTIAYITLSSVFAAIAFSSASLSFAADSTFTSQPQNTKWLLLAYADLAESKKPGGAKTSGGEYGMSLMDKNKDNKVSKEEFLKYNEAIFNKIDTNHDGSVDKNEANSYVSKKAPKTSPNYSTSHGEMKK